MIGVSLDGEVKEVYTGSGTFRGRAVILATGSMGRASFVPGEERLVGRGVSYCATCDAAFFRGRPVAVVGSGEEAVEEALYLSNFAGKVILVHAGPAAQGVAAPAGGPGAESEDRAGPGPAPGGAGRAEGGGHPDRRAGG